MPAREETPHPKGQPLFVQVRSIFPIVNGPKHPWGPLCKTTDGRLIIGSCLPVAVFEKREKTDG